MKALVPCTLAALAVGITTGWMLRGDGGGGVAAADAAAKGAKTEERTAAPGAMVSTAGETSGAGDHSKSQVRVPKDKDKAAEVSPLTDGQLERMMADMKEHQTKRNDARIATLTEKLGLDANQQAKLREYLDERNPATTVSKGEGGKGIKVESKMSDSPGALDDFMKDLLSADQEGKYEQMKETEQNQKVEARTLREMASLTQAVELREDQRQAVYEILEKQARTDVESGGGGMAGGLFMGGAAPVIELAGGVGGAGEVASSVDVMSFKVDGPEDHGQFDQAEIMKQMEQQRKTNIDNKVNGLSGVLDASQLAKYRQSLEQGPMLFSR